MQGFVVEESRRGRGEKARGHLAVGQVSPEQTGTMVMVMAVHRARILIRAGVMVVMAVLARVVRMVMSLAVLLLLHGPAGGGRWGEPGQEAEADRAHQENGRQGLQWGIGNLGRVPPQGGGRNWIFGGCEAEIP
jgi:hypothetical protein